MTFLNNIEIIQEETDSPFSSTKDNTVILTTFNGFRRVDEATFCNWEKAFIFPDKEKADYFLNHTHLIRYDYREAMLEGDYIFHIVYLGYPKSKTLYADQVSRSY